MFKSSLVVVNHDVVLFIRIHSHLVINSMKGWNSNSLLKVVVYMNVANNNPQLQAKIHLHNSPIIRINSTFNNSQVYKYSTLSTLNLKLNDNLRRAINCIILGWYFMHSTSRRHCLRTFN